MARWYARFDAGSETALDNTSSTEGFFTQLRVGSGAGVGAQLRAGLVASRSLLSDDVYADLDAQNKDTRDCGGSLESIEIQNDHKKISSMH